MLLSGLLAALAVTDLLRPSDAAPTKQRRARSWFAGMATVATLGWGLGLSPWIALAGAVVVALWLWLTPVRRSSPWALAGLGVVLVLTVFVFDPMQGPPAGPFFNWFEQAAPAFLAGMSFTAFATAIAAVVGAKSIIRYPEISKSNDGGKTAEYFLIGSGLSWGLALLALALSVVSR